MCFNLIVVGKSRVVSEHSSGGQSTNLRCGHSPEETLLKSVRLVDSSRDRQREVGVLECPARALTDED